MTTINILRLPIVCGRTGLSRSTIYNRIAEGTFPKPVSLGSRAVGWIEAEIQHWLESKIKASRAPRNGHQREVTESANAKSDRAERGQAGLTERQSVRLRNPRRAVTRCD